MLIDCDSCAARALACGDCVVTVLLGAPPHGIDLDTEEQQALAVLAASGLVPPLRLATPGAHHAAGAKQSGPRRQRRRDGPSATPSAAG